MQKPKHLISLSTWVILAYVIFRVAFLFPKWENNFTEATLSWDVFGYYLYLPAYFIYDDLWGLEFIQEVFPKYLPAGDFHHAVQQPSGAYVMKYPIGMAILYLPFFLIGHLFASLGPWAADGFSRPYQFAIAIGSMVYAVLGLWVLRKVLLRYFTDIAVTGVLLIIVLATNYLNYTAIDGPMTHNHLFTLYALLIWLTIKWHEKPQLWSALAIGITVGLATIVRPVELLAILIPLLWGVYDKKSLLDKWEHIREHLSHVGLLILGMVVMGSIQLLYWKVYSGSFLYYSYEEQGFNFLRPHLINGLFSFRKGWLVYTPVMILALVGFRHLYKRFPKIFFPILIYFLINLYVVFSWEIWWYGGSLGSRPLIQSYAALAFPLAAMLAYLLETKSYWQKILAAVFIFLCIDLNLIMTWQAHAPTGGMHPEAMTKSYYWQIFGSAKNTKWDKRFLDVRRSLPSTKGMQITTLYENGFEDDTTVNITMIQKKSGYKSMQMDKDFQEMPAFEVDLGEIGAKKGDWIRVKAEVMYTIMEWNEWQQAQLIMQFQRDGKTYRGTYCRIQRLMDPWVWLPLQYEMRVPSRAKPEDTIKVYVWNAGGQKAVYVDDLKVELIQK